MLSAAEAEQHCYALNRQSGLSDDGVLQLMQLRDGRMVIITRSGVDLYDGQQIRGIRIDEEMWMPIPAYGGATHLFADSDDRLWMKRGGRLYCFDLRTMRQKADSTWRADDFFIDDSGETWLLQGRELSGSPSGRTLLLPDEAGALQDVVRCGADLYCFFDSGTLVCYGKDARRRPCRKDMDHPFRCSASKEREVQSEPFAEAPARRKRRKGERRHLSSHADRPHL